MYVALLCSLLVKMMSDTQKNNKTYRCYGIAFEFTGWVKYFLDQGKEGQS